MGMVSGDLAEEVLWTGPPSESFVESVSVGVVLWVATRYHPRPGMYSYTPGTGSIQCSVRLWGRSSCCGFLNHLCGEKTFCVATNRFGVILSDLCGQKRNFRKPPTSSFFDNRRGGFRNQNVRGIKYRRGQMDAYQRSRGVE